MLDVTRPSSCANVDPMDQDQIRNRITQTLLVKLLPQPMQDRFIELLLSVSEQGQVTSGETLFKRGDTNTDQACLILEGMLKVTRGDGEIRYIEAPDILGEVQLFKPQAERTATVDVVIGGPTLTFKWHDLGGAAKKQFSDDEMAALRETIMHSASIRERNILQRENDGSGPASS